jgi:hypothetical protein
MTMTSDGIGEVCGATDPKAGTGHGTVVAVVGAPVVTVVAGVPVVRLDELVLVVAGSEVVVRPVAVSSSSPLQAAAASDSTRASASNSEVGLVRTHSR